MLSLCEGLDVLFVVRMKLIGRHKCSGVLHGSRFSTTSVLTPHTHRSRVCATVAWLSEELFPSPPRHSNFSSHHVVNDEGVSHLPDSSGGCLQFFLYEDINSKAIVMERRKPEGRGLKEGVPAGRVSFHLLETLAAELAHPCDHALRNGYGPSTADFTRVVCRAKIGNEK